MRKNIRTTGKIKRSILAAMAALTFVSAMPTTTITTYAVNAVFILYVFAVQKM